MNYNIIKNFWIYLWRSLSRVSNNYEDEFTFFKKLEKQIRK